MEDFCAAIIYGGNIMGYKQENMPNAMFLAALFRIFSEHHKDITAAELRLAFDLYAAQKIGIKIESFGEINGVFIGKLLNDFRNYRTEHAKSEAMALPANDYQFSEEQKNIAAKQFILATKNQFDEFKAGKKIVIPYPGNLFTTLVQNGLIKENYWEPYTDEARMNLIDRAKTERVRNVSQRHGINKRIDRLIDGESMNDEDTRDTIQEAKYLAIIAYYKSISELKINV